MELEEQLALLSRDAGPSFFDALRESRLAPLTATGLEILQINVTRRCNLSCKHCHVDAGPSRQETMSRETMERCLEVAGNPSITTIDITGGSPELHPLFPWFLEEASRTGRRVLVRSNLAILTEEQYRPLIDLYARLHVEVVGSLPAARREPSERQRGKGTFDRCVAVLRALNDRGYGREGTGLVVDLVHNPPGAYLPGPQTSLEGDYKRRLAAEHGIVFNHLFCLTNCPVGRFLEFLIRTDNLDEYMTALRRAYNPAAAANVMCRTTLSVGWDGRLYDCDFNQMLGLTVNGNAPRQLEDFRFDALATREIVIRNHCFACTAGAGSSCQGVLEK